MKRKIPEGLIYEDGKWGRLCPTCSEKIFYNRKDYAVKVAKKNGQCRTCQPPWSNTPMGSEFGVPTSWFRNRKTGAEDRNLDFTITQEDLSILLKDQQGLCAYTNLPIKWNPKGHQGHPISIDRIDNNLGYIPGNIQLVLPEVNFMKGTLTDERFRYLCSRIK